MDESSRKEDEPKGAAAYIPSYPIDYSALLYICSLFNLNNW